MTDLILPQLEYIQTHSLKHSGDCCLLAVTSDQHIYAEEIYGAEGWLAQHHLSPDGSFVATIDEDDGRTKVEQPLPLPEDAAQPATGWHTMWLNFAGPRHRGIRSLERVDELVRPFTLQDKIHLSQHPALKMPPPMILGLAESYVLAEAKTVVPGVYFVCRRLRIAFVTGKTETDETGEPFDYDSRVIYVAHFAARSAALDESLVDQMQPLPGITPSRPMDCAIFGNQLYVADGGEADRVSAVHVWKITSSMEILTEAEKMIRRIYG